MSSEGLTTPLALQILLSFWPIEVFFLLFWAIERFQPVDRECKSWMLFS